MNWAWTKILMSFTLLPKLANQGIKVLKIFPTTWLRKSCEWPWLHLFNSWNLSIPCTFFLLGKIHINFSHFPTSFLRITETDWIVEVGRNHRRLSSPSPLALAGSDRLAAHGHVRSGFSIFKDGETTTSPGSLFQCLTYPYSRSLMFHVFHFMPTASCPVTWHHPLYTFPSSIYTLMGSPWAFSKSNSPSSLSLSFLVWDASVPYRSLGPALDAPQYVSISLVLGNLELDTVFQCGLTSAEG